MFWLAVKKMNSTGESKNGPESVNWDVVFDALDKTPLLETKSFSKLSTEQKDAVLKKARKQSKQQGTGAFLDALQKETFKTLLSDQKNQKKPTRQKNSVVFQLAIVVFIFFILVFLTSLPATAAGFDP